MRLKIQRYMSVGSSYEYKDVLGISFCKNMGAARLDLHPGSRYGELLLQWRH